MKTVAVLGSTGSIGRSALDVLSRHTGEFTVVGLSAGSNAGLLKQQADRFNVKLLALEKKGTDLFSDAKNKSVPFSEKINLSPFSVMWGGDGATELIKASKPDFVINGISGAAGFLPSLEAIRQGAVLALANKESLVIGGAFITEEAALTGARIVPVDSEHSAIFQCLAGEDRNEISRIILTASGGPFRTRPKETFSSVTREEALNHPTWSMGKRITIDSATMMNKGLEIIEAHWLFGVPLPLIEVVVHPQSIIHSMVEFHDMSIKAQMGIPDMRIPIAYALSWPGRMNLPLKPLEMKDMGKLEFFDPDEEKFPALKLARSAMEDPKVLPCIMNAADEKAVEGFLKGRIRFDQIIDITTKVMDKLAGSRVDSPADLLELDTKSRYIAETLLS